MTLSNIFNYIIDKIKSTDLLTDPYEHIWIENILTDDHYSQLRDDFESKEYTQEDDDHSLSASVGWNEFSDFCKSSELYTAIQQKLTATRLHSDVDKFVVNYLKDLPEHHIGLHSDAKGKETLQWHIYCPDIDYDKWGTIFCLNKDRLGKKEFPLKRNAFLAYGKNPGKDLHYTEPGDRIRKSLLVRYR